MTGKQCQPDDSEDNQSRIKLIAEKRRLLEEKSAQVRRPISLPRANLSGPRDVSLFAAASRGTAASLAFGSLRLAEKDGGRLEASLRRELSVCVIFRVAVERTPGSADGQQDENARGNPRLVLRTRPNLIRAAADDILFINRNAQVTFFFLY